MTYRTSTQLLVSFNLDTVWQSKFQIRRDLADVFGTRAAAILERYQDSGGTTCLTLPGITHVFFTNSE